MLVAGFRQKRFIRSIPECHNKCPACLGDIVGKYLSGINRKLYLNRIPYNLSSRQVECYQNILLDVCTIVPNGGFHYWYYYNKSIPSEVRCNDWHKARIHHTTVENFLTKSYILERDLSLEPKVVDSIFKLLAGDKAKNPMPLFKEGHVGYLIANREERGDYLPSESNDSINDENNSSADEFHLHAANVTFDNIIELRQKHAIEFQRKMIHMKQMKEKFHFLRINLC